MRNNREGNLVLIADDDLFIRKVLSETLKAYAKITEAVDGAEVLDKYKADVPDMVFLDVHMPNVNGLDLVKEIKAFDPEAYIVMITSDSKRENVESAIKNGASGFIAKPFDKQTIIKGFHRCPTVTTITSVTAY